MPCPLLGRQSRRKRVLLRAFRRLQPVHESIIQCEGEGRRPGQAISPRIGNHPPHSFLGAQNSLLARQIWCRAGSTHQMKYAALVPIRRVGGTVEDVYRVPVRTLASTRTRLLRPWRTAS
jgi:hypothetical protein